MVNKFNIERLIKILYFLQEKKHFDFLKLLKLYYFAERHHIRTYGLFMNEDDYYAMPKGTVASAAKDVLSKSLSYLNFVNKDEEEYINSCITFDSGNYSCFISEQSTTGLSKSSFNSIEFALITFSSFHQLDLSNFTHDYPEWKKFEIYIKNGETRIKESIEDFFLDPDYEESCYIKKYFKEDPYAQDLELTRYIYSNYLKNKKIDEFMNSTVN